MCIACPLQCSLLAAVAMDAASGGTASYNSSKSGRIQKQIYWIACSCSFQCAIYIVAMAIASVARRCDNRLFDQVDWCCIENMRLLLGTHLSLMVTSQLDNNWYNLQSIIEGTFVAYPERRGTGVIHPQTLHCYTIQRKCFEEPL